MIPVIVDKMRIAAAERIKAIHRRNRDGATAVDVKVTERDAYLDNVRVEYADGEVREFVRSRVTE